MPQTLYRETDCAGVKNRQKVLLLDKAEWDGYQHLLVKDALKVAEVEALRRKKEAVKLKSVELRKTWKNTTEDARNKQLQARADRLAADQREKEQRSLEMQQIRAEERVKYLEECRRITYYRQDDVRVLNSALVAAETLREREAQKQLERQIKAAEAAQEKVWAAKVFEDVAAHEQEEAGKYTAQRVAMYAYRDLLVTQMKDIAETRARDAQERKLLEVADLAKGKAEMELAQRLERDELRRQQRVVKKDFDESAENARVAAEVRKKHDADEAKVMFVYSDTIARVEARRKQKVAEDREARTARMEYIARAVGVVQQAKDEAEAASIRAAIAERDAKDAEQQRKEAAYAASIRQQRIDGYIAHLAAEEARKATERNLVKWDLLQGFKSAEVDKAFFDKLKKKRADGLMANRLVLEAAIAQKQKERAADVFDLHTFLKAKDDKMNADYFKYADEVLADSAAQGRKLYPMQRAVGEYKRAQGLAPRRKTRTLHVSSVPCAAARNAAVVPQVCDCRVGPQKILD